MDTDIIAYFHIQCRYTNEKPCNYKYYIHKYAFDIDGNQLTINSPLAKCLMLAVAKQQKHFKEENIGAEGLIFDYKIFNTEYLPTAEINTFNTIDLTKTTSQIVWVYKGRTKCQTQNHKIETVLAKVEALNHDRCENIKIFHCLQCEQFFIDEKVLISQEKKYGFLLFYKKPYSKSNSMFIYNRQERSDLLAFGYSVKSNGLSKQERQLLLTKLIIKDRFKEYEIINHLKMLITINGSYEKFYEACFKWEDDLNFVLNTNFRDTQLISGILKYKYTY